MLFPQIERFFSELPMDAPSQDRAEKWDALAKNLFQNKGQAAINFICTHNARRSVLSQCLAAALAHKLGLPALKTWSGGAEETFVHPNTIAALKRIGFRLESHTEGINPIYKMRFSNDAPAQELFSKKFDAPSSPAPYHAILVCSKGDAACPFIPNTASRSLIPFDDPGSEDGTTHQDQAYDEAAKKIGAELGYLFSQLTS